MCPSACENPIALKRASAKLTASERNRDSAPIFLELVGPDAHPRRELQLRSDVEVGRVGFGLGKILEQVCNGGVKQVLERDGDQWTSQILYKVR